jgi:hypothetical protein
MVMQRHMQGNVVRHLNELSLTSFKEKNTNPNQHSETRSTRRLFVSASFFPLSHILQRKKGARVSVVGKKETTVTKHSLSVA